MTDLRPLRPDVRERRRHRGGDEWPAVPVFAETGMESEVWKLGRVELMISQDRSEIKARFYNREIDTEDIWEGDSLFPTR